MLFTSGFCCDGMLQSALGWNLRPTSRICVMTRRVASKVSDSIINMMPAHDRFSSLRTKRT